MVVVWHFTYLGSVISSEATVTKDLDNRLSKVSQFLWKTVKQSMAESLAPLLHKDPGVQGRRHSHPPVRCRDLGSLSETDQMEQFHRRCLRSILDIKS